MKDYYKILQINKEASPEIIAKVYKILAKKYHPDLQNDKAKQESEEIFKEIAEAYEILSDEEKRKQYDEQLESINKQNFINKNDYETLKNYCLQLEEELNNLKSNYSYSNNVNTQNSYSSVEYQRAQQKAHDDALNKAYYDTYINNLKNLGYKIKYKKTFKETIKNFCALILTALIIFVMYKILWTIPEFKEYVLSLFII